MKNKFLKILAFFALIIVCAVLTSSCALLRANTRSTDKDPSHEDTNLDADIGEQMNDSSTDAPDNGETAFVENAVIARFSDDYGYHSLADFENGEAMQNMYKNIAEAAEKFHFDSTLDVEETSGKYVVQRFDFSEEEMTKDDAVAVWSFFKNDHPIYYWISPAISYGDTHLTLLTDAEYANGEGRARFNELIAECVEQYASKVSGESSPYRIALALHDAVITDIDYAYETDGKTPEDAVWAHNILGAFEKKSGVCESYAKTFQLLLNYCGVENIYVTGVTDDSDHAWNMVMMDDGEWYWVDLTWDDTPDWMWGISYNYFCVNDMDEVSLTDGPWVSSVQETFSDTHTPFLPTDEGTDRQYELPERSKVSALFDGIVMLRDGFTVDGYVYAVVGYNAVQLVGADNTTDLSIPEAVIYNGVKYDVISIGDIDGKRLVTGKIEERGASVKYVSIPKSVIFIWDKALMLDKLESITVATDNPRYASLDGVLFTKTLYTLVQYPIGNGATSYSVPDATVELANFSFGNGTPGALRHLKIGRSAALVGTMNAGYGYRDGADDRILNTATGDFFYISGLMDFKGELSLNEENINFVLDGGALYNSDKTVLHAVCDKSIKTFVCPKSVKIIDVGAFFSCEKLGELTLHADLEEIRTYAIGYCNILILRFEGSSEEWNSLQKNDDWDYKSSILIIKYE